MKNKLLGSILIILGTCIGAGLIALPVATGSGTLLTTILTVLSCWLIMTVGAFALAEVNIRMPVGANIISISGHYFKVYGRLAAWLLYLSLMYSLSAAYLSAISDFFYGYLNEIIINISLPLVTVMIAILFLLIIGHEIQKIDIINRCLMLLKACLYCSILIIVIPVINAQDLIFDSFYVHWPGGIIAVIFTSFGYAVIVPTVTEYLERDRRKILLAITIGSIIPLILYLLWIIAVQGVLPASGPNSLETISNSENVNMALFNALESITNKYWLGQGISIFMFLAVLTSSLGVIVSLYHFLIDGLQLNKTGYQAKLCKILTIVPPTLFALFAPGIFITALSYAGIVCLFLLVVLPISCWIKMKIKEKQDDFRDERI